MKHAHHTTPHDEITGAGGAYVRRRFGDFAVGDKMSAAQVAEVPTANLHALINTGMIELWPAGPGQTSAAGGQRYMIHLGKGEYIVVQGIPLTTKTVSRTEAEGIVKAGAPDPMEDETFAKASAEAATIATTH